MIIPNLDAYIGWMFVAISTVFVLAWVAWVAWDTIKDRRR